MSAIVLWPGYLIEHGLGNEKDVFDTVFQQVCHNT